MTQESRESRNDVLAKIEKARQHVFALCKGDERWTMRVPANPERDSDLLICDALNAAEKFIQSETATSKNPLFKGEVGPDGVVGRYDDKVEQLRNSAAVALRKLEDIKRFLPNTPEGDDLAEGCGTIRVVLEEVVRCAPSAEGNRLALSADDILENAAIEAEGTFGRAHTYASENADTYRTQDHAIAQAAKRIRAMKGRYTVSHALRSEPIGEVVGHEVPGRALVRWYDNGLRPLGMKLYCTNSATGESENMRSALEAIKRVTNQTDVFDLAKAVLHRAESRIKEKP